MSSGKVKNRIVNNIGKKIKNRRNENMTYCPKLFEKVKNGIDEEKSIEEIGKALCGDIKHPARKVRRIIKMSFGRTKKGKEDAQKYIEEHAEILKYKKPNNRSGKNKKSEVKFFTSEEGIIEQDETTEELGENETIQITIKPSVQKRLEFLKTCSTKNGKPIKTDNRAIRYALKQAGLWNILE